MMLILVHTISRRLNYILNWMFSGEPGIEYRCTTEADTFRAFQGPKFQYGDRPLEPEIPFWPAHGLLEETGIRPQPVDEGPEELLFPVASDSSVTHDPFSACFYLLSRYEEYLPFQPDQHGRFDAGQSVLSRKGLTEFPLADAMRQKVIERLVSAYPEIAFKPYPFRATITIDIDQAFEFKGKSAFRTLGSLVKSGFSDRNRLARQIHVLRGVGPDPFDTYDFIQAERKRSGLDFQFFILCRSGTAHDHQVTLQHPAFRKLIRKLAIDSEPGIHPSYYSNGSNDLLQKEISILEKLTGKKIIRSRQHYLRLFIPGTYRKLIAAGIVEDYSMGYSSAPGFRAGTCSPFLWYDLQNETTTNLKIFPCTFMEGTFADYLGLSAESAWERMEVLMRTVEQFNGHFIPIWHNHTVSQTAYWKPWRNVFLKMIHWLEERTA